MKRWNMTPQLPKKKALQQDPVAVSKWLEETYPQIEQRAKAENALILWQDETAVKQDSNWVRSYAPRGQTPVLIDNARTNYGAPVMISAVNNQGKCFLLLQRKAVNAYHFIRFLHRLILDLGSGGRKLFVICDNARIHHARLVQRWIDAPIPTALGGEHQAVLSYSVRFPPCVIASTSALAFGSSSQTISIASCTCASVCAAERKKRRRAAPSSTTG